ncbi:phospholipase D-like domain-containing protein [Sphingomonas humi]|uniref:Phospholipase D n=1 Tax=Sphingomonas humi TaxID=335630 RepID=A0ABP7RQS5_9SPHN
MSELLEPGRNCWRIEQAARAAVIVDACDYYRIIREAMLQAKHRIMIIGWDFDPRIILDRTNSDQSLGDFLLELARTKPNVPIKILSWRVGAFKLAFRGSALLWLARLAWTKAIRFVLDGAHPPGCSHHQKIVVIDDCFAICGGIDMTADRWDRPAHADNDPGRTRPSGQPYGPWHDATMASDGALAAALAELGRTRWEHATGEHLPAIEDATPIWPEQLEPQFEGSSFGIARTVAPYRDWDGIHEIEALTVDLIERARRFIYAENQYLTSPRIAAAIMRRMAEPDPPEIVLVMPIRADGWLEQAAMDATRLRLMQIIGTEDVNNRFRIFTPKTEGDDDIYVHAKLMIADDQVLKIGSANLNNRSMGLDSECDVLLDAATDAEREALTTLRTRLMAEHTDRSEQEVIDSFGRTGSLLATIAELTKVKGRRLEPLAFEQPTGVAKAIAERELLDPKSPDAMFESMTERTLFKPLRGRLKALRRRGHKLPA